MVLEPLTLLTCPPLFARYYLPQTSGALASLVSHKKAQAGAFNVTSHKCPDHNVCDSPVAQNRECKTPCSTASTRQESLLARRSSLWASQGNLDALLSPPLSSSRARTGRALEWGLEELLAENRRIRRPHFESTGGLLAIHLDDNVQFRLNAAKSGLRQARLSAP